MIKKICAKSEHEVGVGGVRKTAKSLLHFLKLKPIHSSSTLMLLFQSKNTASYTRAQNFTK